MKNILLVGLPVLFLMLVFSCTKDKTDEPQAVACSTVDSTTNTYNLKIRQILETNCYAQDGCHDNEWYTGAAGVDLEDYEDAKASFQTKNVLCAVKHEQGCSPMPDGAPKLADSLITSLQCWAESGYKQ